MFAIWLYLHSSLIMFMTIIGKQHTFSLSHCKLAASHSESRLTAALSEKAKHLAQQ